MGGALCVTFNGAGEYAFDELIVRRWKNQ